ncbi:murein DD-endopeptidase MepM/ murein hydrolase activator NlpD [Novosphingobium sp. PhB165]|uniref:LysM peptidoglycan-binding domain-containing M23 family metallopeptidase n=1 Tax=Novosphingobium sp. PhB165 TaxID=2485105 RepID=UPI00104F3767|nr:LysM peptidoglycan-binding domain-containing M23 family metallopeptidase [Novosphingobium sp. PhB165]TCM19514.1 murein DD-endopeptidase MepM/ murein hydrolase activator NlpD [Novosphingobium sp. PhB165]
MIRRAFPLFAALALAGSPAFASTKAETVHVVAPGETLNGIANRAGVSASAIVKANGLKQPYTVKAGQKLTIPRGNTGPSAPKKTASVEPAPEPTAAASNRTAAKAQVVARNAAAASAQTEEIHVVEPGETLGGIAERAKVARVLIIEANGLRPPYAVKTGQNLRIPRTRRHSVKSGETGFSIAYQYAVPWEQVALANGLDPQKPVKVGQSLLIPTLVETKAPAPVTPPAKVSVTAAEPTEKAPPRASSRFLWPVAGKLGRRFASGADPHDGIDIKAPAGTMVRAAAAGTVKFAGSEKQQFGNLVVLDHGGGWFTAYGFLSRVTVKDGAKVAAGERVGLVGNTGLAKGDELHFEVRRDGKPVDPLDELPKAP